VPTRPPASPREPGRRAMRRQVPRPLSRFFAPEEAARLDPLG
jgi:hypothetical protein